MIQAAVQQRLSDRTSEEPLVWRNEFSTVFPAISLHNTYYTNLGQRATEKRQPMLALSCPLGAAPAAAHAATTEPSARLLAGTARRVALIYFFATWAVSSPRRTRASAATACVLGSVANADHNCRALAVSPASA